MAAWLKRGFLNLWRKPFRTVLVALFLSLVVGLFTVMATVNRLASERFAELEGALESVIDVRPIGSLGLGGRRSRPLSFALPDEIRAMGADLRVDAYLIGRELEDGIATFYVGVRPGAPLLAVGDPEPMDGRVVAGRTFEPGARGRRAVVIGLDAARRFGLDPETFAGDATVSIKDRDWRVIGLFDGGNGFTNAQVFLTFDAMADAFGAKGVSRVVVRAASAARAAETADALRSRLAGEADVVTNRPAVALAQATLAGIGGATRTGALVFFIAGALVVMGAMILVFRDQRREIGIEKALGASNGAIARRMIIESVMLSALGGAGGLVVAWIGLGFFARSWTSIKFGLVQSPLSPQMVGIILLACMALGILGSLWPIARSRGLDPVVILREE